MMINLKQALEEIRDRKDFAVTNWYGTTTINYLIRLPDTFDGIRVNFRGITFDEKTGKLLSLPMHKFMNVNETEDTQFDKLKDLEATIYEKLDGTMIHWLNHPCANLVNANWLPVGPGLVSATRMRPATNQAQEAMEFACKVGLSKLMNAIQDSVNSGFTPLFEYVSPKNPIVITYNKSQLVYLMSRNRTTGEYVREPRLMEFDHAQEHKFKFSDLMDQLKDKTEFEGYVCHLSNGMIVKAKTPWYLERHRVVDLMMEPVWRVWESVYNNTIDDAVALAADIYKPLLRRVWVEAQTRFIQERVKANNVYREAWVGCNHIDDQRERRKRFVELVGIKNEFFGPAMLIYDTRDVIKPLQQKILDDVKKTHRQRLCAHFEDIGSEET